MFSFIATPNTVTVFNSGKTYTAHSTTKNFESIKALLSDYVHAEEGSVLREYILSDLLREFDVASAVNKASAGRVELRPDGNGGVAVFYGDVQTHHYVAERIVSMYNQGFPVDPLLKFLEKLFKNRSEEVINDLYAWMEKAQLPVTMDGDFIAYKKVKNNYKSIHDGTTDNSIGALVKEDPNVVDWNRNNTCSRGLHFCSIDYLPNFGSGSSGGDRIVIVKINPAHVCSIPTDYDLTKGRAFEYTVIGEVEGPEADEWMRRKPVLDNFGVYDDRDTVEEEEEYNDEDSAGWYDGEPYELDSLDELDEVFDKNDPVMTPENPPEKPEAWYAYRGFSREYIIAAVGQFGKRGAAKQMKMSYSTLWDWLQKHG
jgi:hypothetical protein